MATLLDKTIENIEEIKIDADGAIRARLDELAIPRKSLGRLEELAIVYASIRGTARTNKFVHATQMHKVIFTMAGDHGIVEEGVSLFPQEVTRQMVLNFIDGGAAINVLARHVGARVIVVDCGVASDFGNITPPQSPPSQGGDKGGYNNSTSPRFCIKKIGYGTKNMLKGPAMSRGEAMRAIEGGIEVFEEELPDGIDIAGTGDMGIGNTTPSSAILAVLTGTDIEEVTGRGTGLDDIALKKKIATIKQVLKVNKPDVSDPVDVLAKVGGFEIGAIAGLCLAAARHRIPVLLDGFISTVGALIACRLSPKVNNYLIASHKSVEKGHGFVLEYLGKKPLLDLNLRLGEGTGAALGMSLVEAGVKILTQMATFSNAKVSKPQPT
ncbi:MAG TPA: nicotinate-nucleotide--dimethylbenzimidazole phosphoribosyltransferase [Candidatus Brocadiia bacterium]|nr:nicotinate-nucleotide--dimethylbenzimidazole phosphoribosyltransferase [Planctomycetota bacterium]MDO8092619.1 nicotinate-nucleotide--dimethylbenzimidazole phosphoribosyltransferase [Candidatus Brocadiales bacterium]